MDECNGHIPEDGGRFRISLGRPAGGDPPHARMEFVWGFTEAAERKVFLRCMGRFSNGALSRASVPAR